MVFPVGGGATPHPEPMKISVPASWKGEIEKLLKYLQDGDDEKALPLLVYFLTQVSEFKPQTNSLTQAQDYLMEAIQNTREGNTEQAFQEMTNASRCIFQA